MKNIITEKVINIPRLIKLYRRHHQPFKNISDNLQQRLTMVHSTNRKWKDKTERINSPIGLSLASDVKRQI